MRARKLSMLPARVAGFLFFGDDAPIVGWAKAAWNVAIWKRRPSRRAHVEDDGTHAWARRIESVHHTSSPAAFAHPTTMAAGY